MKNIVIWGEKMPLTGRIYERGSINLPKSNLVDIMLLWDSKDYEIIGNAELVENSTGLFVINTNYFIDFNLLIEKLEKYYEIYTKENGKVKYTTDLTIACMGKYSLHYTEDNKVDFKFLYHDLLSINLKQIVRELKLSSIM